ncbi:uncharacterized protein P174DRAFT_289677 [Aspergillus novofumigatus IBT 16806]|uniref:Uncharacterized protein n=1 Tax=Aspergillus novofumigatus (strain IBT 16806) TaxID=1392255 RepID=A0A2I1BXP1_ASPN1|nr:uncharacterized protein P174DRAFT_289677 [Aspergillus novofumigatus IBT 16806]PKX90136.1 hypothetical protein P174DRAFT_289677 [Aspergillus novofumigatus IBT 16806]
MTSMTKGYYELDPDGDIILFFTTTDEVRHVLSLHGCDLHPFVQPILQDVQNRLRDLELSDFKDESKASGGKSPRPLPSEGTYPSLSRITLTSRAKLNFGTAHASDAVIQGQNGGNRELQCCCVQTGLIYDCQGLLLRAEVERTSIHQEASH